jgi:hypothetical protein
MNTRKEIVAALEDLRAGTFVKTSPRGGPTPSPIR